MRSILHADGDRDLQETHAEFLALHGFQVHTARGGVDCLQKLRRIAPHLLILDLELPWGGGDGVVAIMREEPQLRKIPVVITSTVSSVASLDKHRVPPVVGYFTKPFKLADLLDAVVGPRKTVVATKEDQRVDPRADSAPCGVAGHIMDLEREIQLRTNRRVQDLLVECVNDALIVHGQVQSYYAKQLILVAAMNYLAGREIKVSFDVEVK